MIANCMEEFLWYPHCFQPFWINWLIFNVLSGIFPPLLIMNGLNTYSSTALNDFNWIRKDKEQYEQKSDFM